MLLPAILIAFLSPLLHGASCIVDSHISNNLFKNYTSIVFYNTLINILVLPFLLCFAFPQALNWAVFPFVLGVAAIEVFYQIPYYSALRKIDTSVTVALFSLSKVFIPLLAWLIVDEKLNFGQYVGFSIIIISSLVLNIENPRKIKINKAFYLMLLVSFVLVLETVIYKKIMLQLNWISALFYTTLFSSIMAYCFLLILSRRRILCHDFGIYKKQIRYFLINEVFYQAGELPSVFALSLLPVMVSEGINATQPLFTLLIGVILTRFYVCEFKEDADKHHICKKLICFAFLILGVILTIG